MLGWTKTREGSLRTLTTPMQARPTGKASVNKHFSLSILTHGHSPHMVKFRDLNVKPQNALTGSNAGKFYKGLGLVHMSLSSRSRLPIFFITMCGVVI